MTVSPESQRSSWHPVALVVSLVAVAVVAALGGLASADAAEDYGRLAQPSWAPPGWIFGPMWGLLYLLMGIAAWLVWRTNPSPRNPAIVVYAVQLLANLAWSPLFFGLQLRGLALVDIVILDLLVVVTIALFFSAKRIAGIMLVPYLLWILFATALNYSVFTLNS